MPSEIRKPSLVPPGGWYYVEPSNGVRIDASYDEELYARVKAHRKANNIPIPSIFPQDVIEQVCERAGPEYCANVSRGAGPCRVHLEDILNGTKTLGTLSLELALGRDVMVDRVEAERRARICAGCFRNIRAEGCFACAAAGVIRAAVSALNGGRETSRDGQLESCCICKCSTRSLVWIRKDILDAGLGDPSRYPDHCWKIKP